MSSNILNKSTFWSNPTDWLQTRQQVWGTKSLRPRFLFIDDDLLFGKSLIAVAASRKIQLSVLTSPNQPQKANFAEHEMAIVDYDLS